MSKKYIGESSVRSLIDHSKLGCIGYFEDFVPQKYNCVICHAMILKNDLIKHGKLQEPFEKLTHSSAPKIE